MKITRNIIECCNNTHQLVSGTGKQTCACASDVGDASHVTCVTDELSKSASTLFDDVVDEFCQVDLIRSRFETWKTDYSDSYNEAFIGLCLPKLFTPFVKLELVCWNPLEVRILTMLMMIDDSSNICLLMQSGDHIKFVVRHM